MPKAAGICQICNGKFWKYEAGDSETPIAVPCICLRKTIWREFLTPEIFDAEVLSSPLYQPVVDPKTLDISGDKTEENLLVIGSWGEVRKHLKWCLYGKKKAMSGFTFRTVADEELLSVWLGKKSYLHRAKGVRDDGATYNDLRDLMEDPSLVLLKLGVMQSKNKAASTVLTEALSIRVDLGKPTWIIEGETPFNEDHAFFSAQSEAFIHKHFEVVELEDPDTIQSSNAQPSAEDIRQILEAATKGETTVTFEAEDLPKPKPRVFTQSNSNANRKKGKGGNNSGPSSLLD